MIALRTRFAVSSLTMLAPFRTRDPVAVETSASTATSAIVRLVEESFMSETYIQIHRQVKAEFQ